MHHPSHVIQDETGRIIPNILRDANGSIIVDDNSAFYRAASEAARVKADAVKLKNLGATVDNLTTELGEMRGMLMAILQKLDK